MSTMMVPFVMIKYTPEAIFVHEYHHYSSLMYHTPSFCDFSNKFHHHSASYTRRRVYNVENATVMIVNEFDIFYRVRESRGKKCIMTELCLLFSSTYIEFRSRKMSMKVIVNECPTKLSFLVFPILFMSLFSILIAFFHVN